MKKFLTVLLSTVLFSVLLPFSAQAAIFDSADNYVLSTPLFDDAYLAGGNVTIEQDISGDLYLAGGNITINGNIGEDIVVAGGRVSIYGNVGDDVRVMGGQVSIHGNVGDDVIAAGGQVEILKTAIVNGTLVTGAGYLTMDGNINEDIRGAAGMLFLNGRVGGDVILTVEEKIEFSSSASIEGDLIYSSLTPSDVPEGVVKGQTQFNKFEQEKLLWQVTYGYLLFKLLSLASALLLALVFVLFAPKLLLRTSELARANLLKSFGIGVLSLIAVVVGSIILMITIIGIPLSLIALAGLLIVFYVTKVFVAVWIGSYLFHFNKQKKYFKSYLFLGTAVGLLIYYVVTLIPYVGWVLNIILFLIGVGAIFLTKMEYLKFLKGKKML